MRLGGKVTPVDSTPEAWVAAVQAKGYRAAYCPVGIDADAATIAAYRAAAARADIVIAEVGAWSNPLARDPKERQAAMDKCIGNLRLAEAIGARCCVNLAGSCGDVWYGPHRENLLPATFDRIVATVQEIIDSVQPQQTVYAVETMPWIFPDSVESYVRLVEAIDRPGLGVHFDGVNLVNSPARYFDSGTLIREFVAALGPQIRSVHVKDVQMQNGLLLHLDEVQLGEGAMALDVLLDQCARLDPDLPMMLEHLPDDGAYDQAAAYLRALAARDGLML
jgi:sugar phosphate isomerase/epimerase